MMFVKLVTLFIFKTLVIKSQSQKACTGASYARHMNQRLRCGIFKTLVLNWIDCSKQCTATLNCFSINIYQSENGTEICELIRGTKDSFQEEDCLLMKIGGEHHELSSIHSCSADGNDCIKVNTRKVLPDGWYQLGSSAFKHFKTKKTWKDANDTCSANKAVLATIDSEIEKHFVTEVFFHQSKDLFTYRNIKKSMDASSYWKLDGTDKDINLYGKASYKKDPFGITAVLDLPGTLGSYATTPRIDIQLTSYTIAFWIKLRSVPESLTFLHFYSHPSNPYIFSFGVNTKSLKLYHQGNQNNTGKILFEPTGGKLVLNKWSHVVGTWDRTTKQGRIYQDSTQVGQEKSPFNNVNLPNYGKSFCNVGLSYTGLVINATMRELVVFTRSLTNEEVKLLQDTTAMPLEVWVGPTHPYTSINWVPALQSNNSQCISMKTRGPYQQDKVPCNQRIEFICEKRLN